MQRVDIPDALERWRRSLLALPARLRSVDWAALVRAHWLEAGAFVGVLTLAVLVRVVRLGSIPRMITADETDNLQVAYKIIEGTGPGIFGFDWKPAPIFSLYPLAWSVQLFGETVSDFRMFPVITSLLAIVLFYGLARESMRAPAALAAMALLGTNLWFLHFSRTAWENGNAALFAAGAAWALTRALKSGRRWWWVVVGVFVAFGFYGYFTARFIVIAVALVALFAVVLRQAPWRSTALGLGIAAVVSAALFAPMAKEIVENWDYFNQRTQNVSVFNTNPEEPYEGDVNGWIIAAKNLGRNYRGLILNDASETQRGLWSRYNPINRSVLDLVTTHLFWAGLVMAAIRWRQTYVWWPFFIPVFVAEVFSRGSPDLARALLLAPFYFLFVGIFFDEALRFFRARAAQLAVGAAIVAVGTYIAIANVYDYFDWQTNLDVQVLRMPGVDRCEFEMWRGLAREAAAVNQVVDPAEFEARRAELDCSPVVRKALGLEP